MHRLAPPLAALLALGAAQPAWAAGQPAPPQQPLCTPPQPELAELSGLATDGQRWFAVADGGRRLEVFVLDPESCSTDAVITSDINPYDVEDLALDRDGTLWLADTGDNDLDRTTVALHRLVRDGEATVFRLVYPDGPHDAEALVLDRGGEPYIVTKKAFGSAGVYRPAASLESPGPTRLERVGSVRLGPTETRGGPVGAAGATMVTGAAMSGDGGVLALRTYTDAYLYAVPDGDVGAALRTAPVRIPLPGQPQGEAVALAPDGTLLAGSEGGAPIRAVPGAVSLLPSLPPARPATPDSAPAPPDGATAAPDDGMSGGGGLPPWPAAALAAVVATLLLAVGTRRRRT